MCDSLVAPRAVIAGERMTADLKSENKIGRSAGTQPRSSDSAESLNGIDRPQSVLDQDARVFRSGLNLTWVWLKPVLAIVSLTAIILLGGWTFFLFNSAGESGPRLTHTISRGDLVVSVIEQGTLESSNNSEIKCKVRGYSTVTWVVPGGTIVKPGDVLVRLDTKRLEDEISKHTTDAHEARATYERTKADVENAEIAIDAYLQGTYQTQLKALEQRLDVAITRLDEVQKDMENSEAMFRRGYVTVLEVEAFRFKVREAKLELKVRRTEIDVLNKYTKEMELETLRGNLKSLRSKFKADEAGLAMDDGRRDRAIQELEYCVIKAERGGLVIYPSAAKWKSTPDIAEGATVRKDQVLLLMPDLSQMQVKVGIHESIVGQIEKGLPTTITLPELTLEGNVFSVASVARPAGWWTGNAVKYDTIIELPSGEGIKPGMSAEVEVTIESFEDVILVPVSSIVVTENQTLCWVKTGNGVERRVVKLGKSNDVFIISKDGLRSGEQVVLNPLRYVEDAQNETLASELVTTDSDPVNDEKSMRNQTRRSNAGAAADD